MRIFINSTVHPAKKTMQQNASARGRQILDIKRMIPATMKAPITFTIACFIATSRSLYKATLLRLSSTCNFAMRAMCFSRVSLPQKSISDPMCGVPAQVNRRAARNRVRFMRPRMDRPIRYAPQTTINTQRYGENPSGTLVASGIIVKPTSTPGMMSERMSRKKNFVYSPSRISDAIFMVLLIIRSASIEISRGAYFA